MAVDFQDIGARLRAAREARGFTQAQVARRLRLSPQAVSLIEKGQNRAIETIEAYADTIGCPFVVHVGHHEDATSLLLVRLSRTLTAIDPAVLETLDAWVTLWERKQAAAAGAGGRPAS